MISNIRFRAVLPIRNFGPQNELIAEAIYNNLNERANARKHSAYVAQHPDQPADVAVLLGTVNEYQAKLPQQMKNRDAVSSLLEITKGAILQSPPLTLKLFESIPEKLRNIIALVLHETFAPSGVQLGAPMTDKWFSSPVTLKSKKDCSIALIPDQASDSQYILNGKHAVIFETLADNINEISIAAHQAGLSATAITQGLTQVFNALIGSPITVLQEDDESLEFDPSLN